MIYVLVSDSFVGAKADFQEFVSFTEQAGIIEKAHYTIKYSNIPVVEFDCGNEVHFVPKGLFNSWCLGRTYKDLLGDNKKVYHGGYEIGDASR